MMPSGAGAVPTAKPGPSKPTTYPKVIQAHTDISAHLQESWSTQLVQQDVDGDSAVRACLLKIFKNIQVCQAVCHYGNHLQQEITEVIK